MLARDADPAGILSFVNTPTEQSVTLADGTTIAVTSGADGVQITID